MSTPLPTDGHEPPSTAAPPTESPKKSERNAFTELMSRKKPQQQQQQQRSSSPPSRRRLPNVFKNRDGLGAYIEHPESFPQSVVVYYTSDFVAIHDLYPKSTVHLLLLPRDPTKFFQHPLDALNDDDPEFLSKARAEASRLCKLAGSELRRKFGRFSRSDQAREEAMMNADPEEPDVNSELSEGRKWEDEVMVGIHAQPSMNHLHIHVISADRYSPRLRHRKHYNSFATPFFVPLDDFPLAADDPRRHPGREGYLAWDMKCWRCGKNFGNQFARLKEHLEKEFEEWKCL